MENAQCVTQQCAEVGKKLNRCRPAIDSTPQSLKMSYAPGTYLTIGSDADYEKVVVLSGGKVMYRELGYGKPHREIMSLEDWLILAADARLTVHWHLRLHEHALPPIEERQPAAQSAAQPAAQPAVQPAAEPVQVQDDHPAGTVARYVIDDNNTRSAVKLKNGTWLQVKDITNGERVCAPGTWRCNKIPFNTYQEWINSLPAGGQMSHKSYVAAYERMRATPIVAATDPEMVQKLLETWGIRSFMLETRSTNEALAQHIENYNFFKARLNDVSVEEALENPRYFRSCKRHLTSSFNNVRRLKEYIARWPESNHDRRPCSIAQRGTAQLLARIGGEEKSITYHKGKIGCGHLLYNSFAELGVDMKNGKPDLAVLRYRKITNLA